MERMFMIDLWNYDWTYMCY